MNPNEECLIVFYDGLCGFCDRTVRFILSRDRKDRFRFAPLQGELAQELLPKHGIDPSRLDTLYLFAGRGSADETVVQKSDAAIRIGRELGGAPRFWARLFGLLPRGVRDWGYDTFARRRYRWFGKFDECRIPSEQERAKFIS